MSEFHIPLSISEQPLAHEAAKKPPVQIQLNESDLYTANALWEDTQDPDRGTDFARRHNNRKLGAAIIKLSLSYLFKQSIQHDENGKP